MPIESDKPVSVPAQDAKTYDKWHVTSFTQTSPNPNLFPTALRVTYRRYRLLGDGTMEFYRDPMSGDYDNRVLEMPDLLAEAAADPDRIGAAVANTLALCGIIAKERGIID